MSPPLEVDDLLGNRRRKRTPLFAPFLLSASASTAGSARLRVFRKLGWIKDEQRIPSPIVTAVGLCHL